MTIFSLLDGRIQLLNSSRSPKNVVCLAQTGVQCPENYPERCFGIGIGTLGN